MHAQLSPGRGTIWEGTHAGASTVASMRQAARATMMRMRKLVFSTEAKVAGDKNLADALTKPVDRNKIDEHVKKTGGIFYGEEARVGTRDCRRWTL